MQQKLKLLILDKLIENKVSSSELNFILYISHYQDDSGNIRGVYYKDVCEAIQISPQTFYESLKNLQKKNIITYTKDNYGDWNICIIDNDFPTPAAYKDGYISTGHDLFSDKKFYRLKVNEKLMAMYIIKIAGAGRGSYHIRVDNLYDKFKELFGVTKRVIQRYLTSLKAFFSIGIKNGLYWMHPLRKIFKSDNAAHDIDIYADHLAKIICRRNRIKYEAAAFEDTAYLIKQYAKEYRSVITNAFTSAVEKSIQYRNQGIKNPYHWNRSLQTKYIHKLLIEELQ